MHPGVAAAAERDEVRRVVVCRVQVDVVDVEVRPRAADGASLPVAVDDDTAHLLPPRQGILIPRPDGDREPFAGDPAVAPHGKRAPAAEPAETVPVGAVPAERGMRTVKRVQAQLDGGAHDHRMIGYGTG